jgi:hypothetical protein
MPPAEPYGSGSPLVFDTSAWSRRTDAAAAAGRSAGVLHYDRHFDTLCRVLGIESVWIVPPGSID